MAELAWNAVDKSLANQLPVATTIANGPILVVEKKVINATEVSIGSVNRFTLHTVNT